MSTTRTALRPRALSGCAVALALCLLLSGCGNLRRNQPPEAAFSYSLTSAEAPTTIELDASGSFDPDGDIVSYLWSVNGSHHGGQLASVPLTQPGEQSVRLIVTDDRGATASAHASFWLDLAPAAASGPSPASLELSANTQQTVGASLQVSNAGGHDLSLAVASSASWLSAIPSGATVQSGESATFAVSAGCGEEPGARVGDLVFVTNDPARPSFEARVTLACEAPGGPAGEFQITLLFSGADFTAERQQVFLAAAARWSEVILGDLPDVEVSQPQVTACGSQGSFTTPGVVDDLLVLATIRPIDGPGKVLGMAGVCYRRSGALGLPVVGQMTLDSADVAVLENQGRLFGVVLHEIGHLLDLNQQGWNRHGLLEFDQGSCSASSAIEFIGVNAVNEWTALGAPPPLPVEADGGAGTKCSHWDEEELGSELMTGWASGGMELSKVTVGALHDLGYQVDYGGADAFTPAGLGPATADAIELVEIFLPELGTLDPLDDSGSDDGR